MRSWTELNDYYSNEQPCKTESHQGFLTSLNGNSHQPAHQAGELSTMEMCWNDVKPWHHYEISSQDSFPAQVLHAEKNFLKQPSIISHCSSESWPCVPEKGLAKSSPVRAKLRKLHLNPAFQLNLILTWLGIAQRLKDKFQLAAGCLTYHLSLECLKILSTEATVKFHLQVWLAKAEQNSLWFKLLADFFNALEYSDCIMISAY